MSDDQRSESAEGPTEDGASDTSDADATSDAEVGTRGTAEAPEADADVETDTDGDVGTRGTEEAPEADADVETDTDGDVGTRGSEEAPVETDDGDGDGDGDGEESGIREGDFVRLAYTVRTVDEGTVVDTTDQEVAEEAGIDDDEYDFSPRVIVIGEGHVFPGVDEALVGAEAGDTGSVEISAEEAFGEFDPDDVRTVSADKIPEDDRYPGAHIQIDGQQGHLETIIGGRARVDFNHPLAGEALEYEYEILGVVDDREEKAEGLLGMYLQATPEVWISTDEVEEEVPVEVESDDEDEDETGETASEQETEVQTVEKETLYIEATPQMTMNQQWLFSKQQIAQDLIDRLDLDRVVVQETIEGMGGMMGGMGGMMGGMGGAGGAGEVDIEEAIEDLDIDADEIAGELEGDEGDEDADVGASEGEAAPVETDDGDEA